MSRYIVSILLHISSFPILPMVVLPGCGVISFSADEQPDTQFSRTHIVEMRRDSALVVAGPEYAAGTLHQWLWGEHYRREWTTPITVMVLDLDTFGGGLTPVRRGGGLQTKSLRMKGRDGRSYAFRSVDKDPSKALPPELRGTFAGTILKDQISSSHPAGALIVDVLAESLGVLHPRPILCLMPDDSSLGAYNDFAGLLGILEEHPADGEKGQPGFGGASDIASTLALFRKLDEDSEDRVRAEAFLTARILDMFVGDWDRHIDQWKWAKFRERGRDVWLPIPRDRDQAFARLDGVFPSIGARAVTQVEGFDHSMPDVEALTFSGRFLDRRLLVDLDVRSWDSVTSVVITKLNDSTLEQSVKNIPAPFQSGAGPILSGLKSRREGLAAASRKFYLQLAEYVDIRLSDKPEEVIVERRPEGETSVTAFRRKKSKMQGTTPVYSRLFKAGETKEIRIYLLGGDDRAVVTGEANCGITVRIVGGGGDDELHDESRVQGPLWGFVPFINVPSALTFFYDDSGDNRIKGGPGTVIDTTPYHETLTASRQY